jgi:hypothetical protein
MLHLFIYLIGAFLVIYTCLFVTGIIMYAISEELSYNKYNPKKKRK